MASLFFPQLATGALVHYPVKRSRSVYTAGSEAEDGSRLLRFDPSGSSLSWDLTYSGLTQAEMQALQTLFTNCSGRYLSFTFIDPIANLLTSGWLHSPLIQQAGSIYTNTGNAPLELSQTIAVPANYVYSFSLTRQSDGPQEESALTVIRRGTNGSQRDVVTGKMIVSSGALNDSGSSFTIALELQPGQAVDTSSAQLEAQSRPSPFRAPTGGVYQSAHWTADELTFVADGPDSFGSEFSIEVHV